MPNCEVIKRNLFRNQPSDSQGNGYLFIPVSSLILKHSNDCLYIYMYSTI